MSSEKITMRLQTPSDENGNRKDIHVITTTDEVIVDATSASPKTLTKALSEIDGSTQKSITGAASTVTSNNLTANRVVISNGSGKIAESSATTTDLDKLHAMTASANELNYVKGVTSAVQTQLNAKQATITGAASTVASNNLTANRVVTSDGSGKIAVSTATTTDLDKLHAMTASSTELNYVKGVTSAVQTQLNAKQATITGAASTVTSNTLTASKAVVSDSKGNIAVSDVSSSELGYVKGVTSSIQTQLNAKQATITGAASTIVSENMPTNKVSIINDKGKISTSSVTTTQLSTLLGIKSSVQDQLNTKQESLYFSVGGLATDCPRPESGYRIAIICDEE